MAIVQLIWVPLVINSKKLKVLITLASCKHSFPTLFPVFYISNKFISQVIIRFFNKLGRIEPYRSTRKFLELVEFPLWWFAPHLLTCGFHLRSNSSTVTTMLHHFDLWYVSIVLEQ
jgi:hypothetical protein